jgi:hypothetical protein
MLDEFTVLTIVTSRLEDAGIAYMVTGSIAASLHAEPRMTRAVDIVVELQPADTTRLLIHTTAVVKIDFIIRKDGAYRVEEFRRRRRVEVNGVSICVVSAEDLILSKLDWARDSRSELQLRDVSKVIASQTALDWPYIEVWANRLDLLDLLDEARR